MASAGNHVGDQDSLRSNSQVTAASRAKPSAIDALPRDTDSAVLPRSKHSQGGQIDPPMPNPTTIPYAMQPPSRPTGPRSWRGAPRTPRQSHRQMNPQPRHSQSLTWHSPTYRATGSKLQLNESRRKVCQKSPFWYPDFDLPGHRSEWISGEERRRQAFVVGRDAEENEKEGLEKEIGERFPPVCTIRPLFGGKTMLARPKPGRSSVLVWETIFCPDWRTGKEDIAPWPNRHEMDYEGDGRIATDRLHRRFLPLPRVDSGEAVNWQHRVKIPQYALEEYYERAPRTWDNLLHVSWEDVFFRSYRVADLEFTDPLSGSVDDEGKHAIGDDLMAALDPQDQWV